MDLLSSALVSLFLLACAVGLLIWHVRSWREARGKALEPMEMDFRRRQFRRRTQTSAMLGCLAVSIFVGQVLTPWIATRWFVLIYWGSVLFLLLWVAMLALADILATKYYYERLRRDCIIEQAKLHAEIKRIQTAQATGSNGKAAGKG